LAAKREEQIRRDRAHGRTTSGEHAVPDRSGQTRPVSDSVPSGSRLDRLDYLAEPGLAEDGEGVALPERASDVPFPSEPWTSSLGTLPAESSDRERGDASSTLPPPQTIRDHLSRGDGFYSKVVPSAESVNIPRPPRLPALDSMEGSDAPPPGSDTPPMHVRRTAATEPRIPLAEAVFIPPLLRRQGEEWMRTGSLTLPDTVSSRHARALQRALLLSMLQTTEFCNLPEGIAQRAAWMFREGWGEGKKERDADDLCFVLGLSSGPSMRAAVITAATAHMPAEAILPPSSARWSSPPSRPSR
jgi:hypothetical protein